MKKFKELQDELQELTVNVRDRKTATDRMAQKRDYRKDRAKKIQQMRRYRKSASGTCWDSVPMGPDVNSFICRM